MDIATVNFTTMEGSTNFTSLLSQNLTIVDMYIFSIIVLFGFPTQSYIIWLIVTGAGSGISSEFFLFNLCICEMFNYLVCLMFLLSKWSLGFMMFGLLLQGLLITGRPLFQCLICVERYLAVVHPVIFLKYKPLRYKVMCSSAAWIICTASCLFCFFLFISNTVAAHSCFFVIFFLTILSIQLFCLLAVLRALKQSGPGERMGEREDTSHIKRKAFYLILITTVSMIIIYVPISVSGFLTAMTNKYIAELWYPAFLSYMLGGFLQPVFYLHRCGKLFCYASS
ncbi:chemokine XC receptor 1-like [Triplophysa dalaica]|uniref:chemokine XC receptor 1-like n=1 Tax=Triplophysa dalaica TaxID=1582913 RepID=UPI0024DFE26A|nr:chemokine XC receptor 1-like [Triplophysa dalaica]